MGRDAKQARRDKRRRKDGLGLDGVPPIFRAEFVRVAAAWDRAIDAGPMADGAETKYHFAPDGGVLPMLEEEALRSHRCGEVTSSSLRPM
ncbi:MULTISPECIES: hypothetical protein [unclassified Streptomyces]|uniref:hypothetical protein n=1 Tax=unclassified Streptomyces TaxID=2593676 RepID=UPI00344BF512